MFSGIGMPEILVILLVVLLLFGAKRLPEIGASMGKGIREFKRSFSDINRSITDIDRVDDRAELPRERAPETARREEEKQGSEPKRLLG